MIFNRNRYIYFILIILVMFLGIASRKFGMYLPSFLKEYSGDTLWALMVFLGIGFLLKKQSITKVAFFAIIFSYTIEVSQLYKAPWIDFLRNTTIGALILGHGFLWSDLVCYTIGIAIGVTSEYFIEKIIFKFNIP